MKTKLLLLVTAGWLPLCAQTTAGLTGTVADSTGAVVPGARVAVISAETGARCEAVSNDDGLYQFSLLPPGAYSISVQREGFKQVAQEGVRLFNHPVFDLPNATISSPNAGRITATVGTPRDIQFSLRLGF